MSGGAPGRVAYADLPWGGAPGRVERARGLLDKIGHLLGAVMPAGFAPTAYHSPSSATLLAAIDEQPLLGDAFFSQPAGAPYTGSGAPVLIERVATQLRKQSAALKVQAQTDNEKAIIELVALAATVSSAQGIVVTKSRVNSCSGTR